MVVNEDGLTLLSFLLLQRQSYQITESTLGHQVLIREQPII